MILSTEGYEELMQNIAAKAAAQFSVIPPVSSTTLRTTGNDLSQTGTNDTESIFQRIENSNKNEGDIFS